MQLWLWLWIQKTSPHLPTKEGSCCPRPIPTTCLHVAFDPIRSPFAMRGLVWKGEPSNWIFGKIWYFVPTEGGGLPIPTFGEGAGGCRPGWDKIPNFSKNPIWRLPLAPSGALVFILVSHLLLIVDMYKDVLVLSRSHPKEHRQLLRERVEWEW